MRRRPAIRRALVLVVLALVVVLVVADRLTEQAAARALSVQARGTGLLAADPRVQVRGFPFLTQALRGRYDEIDVTTRGIHRGGLRIDTVEARFRGVHAGLSAVLAGRLGVVPVDAATGTATVTTADLDASLAGRGLTVRTADGALVVAGTVRVSGRRVAVSGPVTATVAGGALALAPVADRLRGPTGALAPTVASAVAAAYAVRVVLAELPFGLVPTSVAVGTGALTLTGAARGITVAVPPDASAA